MRIDEKRNDIGVVQQIILHLLPGSAFALAIFIFGWIAHQNDIPVIWVFLISAVVVSMPLLIGLPILIEKRRHNPITFKNIICYREVKPVWQIITMSIAATIWVWIVYTTLSSFLIYPLREGLFTWFPEWLEFWRIFNEPHTQSRSTMIFLWSLWFLMTGLVGPIVEELYFRGYLLPRMNNVKGWAPLFSAALMAVYHFWSPWLILIRTVALVPMVYSVWWKRSVLIGILVHCTVNLIEIIMLIPAVFG